jgi:hypothetical protein
MGEILLSCTMSALWVGAYGYTYSDPFYNSSPVNWLAFLLWAPGLFLTMRSYRIVIRFIKRPWLGIVITWIFYFTFLLIFEHIGYNILAIRQVTTEGPLIFGLIHGTVALKTYYVAAGMVAVLLSSSLRKVLTRPGRITKTTENGEATIACHYDYHKELNKAL